MYIIRPSSQGRIAGSFSFNEFAGSRNTERMFIIIIKKKGGGTDCCVYKIKIAFATVQVCHIFRAANTLGAYI